MVYDCIPFFNELDILNLRLHILDPYVDRFIIEESTRTFSGEPKELCFEKNREMFREFLPKIDYVVVADDVMMEERSSQAAGTSGGSERTAVNGTAPEKRLVPNPAAALYVTEVPGQPVTHRRDYFQKNHLMNRLFEGWKAVPGTTAAAADIPGCRPLLRDEDIILFGDLDEIPNPEVLQEIIAHFDPSRVCHLAQRNFYVFLNMEEKPVRLHSITGEFPDIPEEQRKWLGTKICSIRSIPAEGIVRLRDLIPVTDPRSVRVENGGWHFGYMGGHHETNVMNRVGTKIRAAAHQEYNDAEIIAETMDKLVLGQDIFGRNAHFERVEIDSTYPQYLRDHLNDYAHLVMPPVTPWMRFSHRLDLTAGRFFRKAWRHVKRKLQIASSDN